MADREKVISEFSECVRRGGWTHCGNCEYKNAHGLLTCEPLAEEILALLKEQEDPCWISVKDKLPPRNANVLWWCVLRDRYMGHVRIGFFEGVTNHDIPEVSCCGPNCIPLYWMPMPNAPTEATIDASGNWFCANGERQEGR